MKGFQSGPMGQEVAGHGGMKSAGDEVNRLGEVVFEGSAEGVAEAFLHIHGIASILHQKGEGTGVWVIGEPGGEILTMLLDKLQEEFCIGAVVLAAAGMEGFPEAGEGFGIERIEDEELIFHEGVDEGTSGLFKADSDRTSVESGTQRGDPLGEGFRGMIHNEVFDFGAAVGRKTDVMFLVSPIESDVSRHRLLGDRLSIQGHLLSHKLLLSKRTKNRTQRHLAPCFGRAKAL